MSIAACENLSIPPEGKFSNTTGDRDGQRAWGREMDICKYLHKLSLSDLSLTTDSSDSLNCRVVLLQRLSAISATHHLGSVHPTASGIPAPTVPSHDFDLMCFNQAPVCCHICSFFHSYSFIRAPTTGRLTNNQILFLKKKKRWNICWFLFGAVRSGQQSSFLPREAEPWKHFHEDKVLDEGVISSHQNECADVSSDEQWFVFLSEWDNLTDPFR